MVKVTVRLIVFKAKAYGLGLIFVESDHAQVNGGIRVWVSTTTRLDKARVVISDSTRLGPYGEG